MKVNSITTETDRYKCLHEKRFFVLLKTYKVGNAIEKELSNNGGIDR